MKKYLTTLLFTLITFFLSGKLSITQSNSNSVYESRMSLSGTWNFKIDSLDIGTSQHWYNTRFSDHVRLPGSMTTNLKGNAIDINTPWTGSIVDSGWFYKPQYAKYRVKPNIKIPFWLQPIKYYKGVAWYQKQINIPANWSKKHIAFYIERCHWHTRVWIDNLPVGEANSLSTPDVFELGLLKPGKHILTVRIDNRVLNVNVGQNSHSISDHTQGNWNGMIGRIALLAKNELHFNEVAVFPDIHKKTISVKVNLSNKSHLNQSLKIIAQVSHNKKTVGQNLLVVKVDSANQSATLTISMGKNPLLWDEFRPELYHLKLTLKNQQQLLDQKDLSFGMREFSSRATHFTINGRLTFLRGTLDCAAFPLTGYPPTDTTSWINIFKKCKSYGLNHIRFHSWCPPEAAFDAADREGMYLQIECTSWANQGATIGDGTPLDKYIYDESNRIVKAYGNHPSFCMMTYGNEPAGKNFKGYLTEFVKYWQHKDNRRLYTTASGWPVIAESDYNDTPLPRIQLWGSGLKSIINAEPPRTDYDWRKVIEKWHQPTVSHEIGQWCVYPDFSEISKYTGILKAKNFEIFQDQLNQNGLGKYAKAFLYNSGKLQALCYKADIEAALRTPGFGGFQLLGLNDFPGQGTALVGVLNVFWQDKGYITATQYSRFCNSVVPLVRFPKMVFTSDEVLDIPLEIAQFGPSVINNPVIKWQIKSPEGQVVFSGNLKKSMIPNGNCIKLGEIKQALTNVKAPSRLILNVQVNEYQNNWDFFVYPAKQEPVGDKIVVTQSLNKSSLDALQNGGKVLLTLKQNSLKSKYGGNIPIGFSSIFWNTAWTKGQAPNTLGIMCDPKHPAFKEFPTQAFSNWQWWDAMSHSNAIELDKLKPGLDPIVRVIDDWVTARSLGLIFECKVGNGSLLVSTVDLLTNIDNRIEAKQLLYSLKKYMASKAFAPQQQVEVAKLTDIYK